MYFRASFAAFAAVVSAHVAISQEIPLSEPAEGAGSPRLNAFWKTSDARRALETGLDDVAYETALDALEFETDPEKRRDLRLVVIDSLFASSKPNEAAELLERDFGDDRSPEIRVRMAMASFAKDDREEAWSFLENLPLEGLDKGSLAWVSLIEGWIGIGENDEDYAGRKWAEAQEYSKEVSPALAAQISYLIYRYRLRYQGANRLDYERLSEDFERAQGTEVGYRYAQQMAAILADRGDRIAATTLIEEQLATLPADFNTLRDQFHLLLAINSNLDGESGRGAARSLVIEGTEEHLMRICLQHVFGLGLNETDERNAFLVDLLDEIIGLDTAHPLVAEALYYRSFIGFLNGEDVETDADRLLTEFRGSPYNRGALSLLASSAWKNSRFRIAARLLRQLRDEYVTEDEKSELRAFIGDCYFRAGQQSGLADDFVSAADGYTKALEESNSPEIAGPLFFQLVLSNLRAGNIVQALSVLDDSEIRSKADSANIWKAEWMALKEMRRTRVTAEAYERAQQILSLGGLDNDLEARFLWLAAKLSVESGQTDETSNWVEQLDDLLSESPAGTFADDFMSEVRSSSRLALAESFFEEGQPEDAIRILEQLRLEFPGRDAALVSYLLQAGYLSSQNSTVEAQGLLVSLADEYPNSRYAPMALYDAAINAERRGQDAFLTQANQLLQRIAQDYPDSDVVYYARLKQADLSRKLNRFAAAQQIYELLENTYQNRPDRYLAQLYLATTLRAQAAEDPSKFDAAINRFELLVDLPDVPLDVRVEAGFQLGVSWEGQGEQLKAKRVYWSLQDMILSEEEKLPRLTGDGWYWLARTLFKLAELLEIDGEIDEANEFYQKIIDLKLYGMETAKTRLGLVDAEAN